MPPGTEVSARFDKAERFLKAAEFLVENGHVDAAPGRAYYAAYHTAVAVLLHRGVKPAPTGRWSHGHVQNRYRALTGDNTAARQLRRLYQDRLVADYTIAPIAEGRARACIVAAGAIISQSRDWSRR